MAGTKFWTNEEIGAAVRPLARAVAPLLDEAFARCYEDPVIFLPRGAPPVETLLGCRCIPESALEGWVVVKARDGGLSAAFISELSSAAPGDVPVVLRNADVQMARFIGGPMDGQTQQLQVALQSIEIALNDPLRIGQLPEGFTPVPLRHGSYGHLGRTADGYLIYAWRGIH